MAREKQQAFQAQMAPKLKSKNHSGFYLSMADSEEGVELVSHLRDYINLTGYTAKRFFLTGAALMIQDNNDNPDLILEIADYLAKGRGHR